MADGNSLINLGDISKPATVLIEKISDAIGGIARPSQIVRVAKAEAEADEIKALSQIRINDLQTRAVQRFIGEETIKQKNIEDITVKALPDLKPNANPQNMDNDWIMNFFDKGKSISNEEMQILWAKVLAGEANSPGTYSKRTVNFLSTLDKSDALLFQALCGFTWMLGVPTPLIYDSQAEIYTKHNVTFDSLTHLDEIGLLSFGSLAGYKRIRLPRRVATYYFGIPTIIEFDKDTDNEIEFGRVMLSKVGQELLPICGAQPVADFPEYVIKLWKKNEHMKLKSRFDIQADPPTTSVDP